MTFPRWLLLAHQLPTRPSNARVKTWRRLQQIGAVQTRNSVYALPNTPECREDFEWIRSEIVAAGGEATVFAADALDADGDQAIEEAFRRSREADYATLKRDADQLLVAARKRPGTEAVGREPFGRAARALRERFSDIERIDFGRAAARQAVAEVLAALDKRLADYTHTPAPVPAAQLPSEDFRNRRWVTRPRPGVDRMASAWLIRRFIDPAATFAFVGQPTHADVPFDMYAGAFSHQGSLCTFEVLAQRFGLRGTAVVRIGQIVHDLDLKEMRYLAPEGTAVGRMVEGLRRVHADDHALLEHGIAMFEVLARSFDAEREAQEPSRRARRQKRSKPRGGR